LESRQLLSVAVLDQSAVVDQLLTPEQMDALAVQEASADLARLRPSPHVGYQQHEAADSVGRVQSAKLSAYVAPPLPTLPRDAAPFVAMFPGLEKYFQAYRAGLDQLHRDIQGNPDARPTIWGNATVDGGGDYRLNLDDNGMVIASWTIDWGDGSQPEKVGDPPWVMHHYADHSAHYTITATASSGEDAEFSEFSAGKGGSRGGGLDTNFTGIHKPTQALDDIYAPSVDATPISDAQATDDGSSITLADASADSATLDGGQMMTMDTGGELDPNFGKITTNFNSNSGFDEGRAVAMQGSSILVAGGTGAGDFGLAKYLDDGSLDTDFDTDGLVTTHFTAGSAMANAVALSPDMIAVAGVVDTGGGTGEIAVADYDPASGECYYAFTDALSTGWDEARAALVLPDDDSIIVAGSSDGQFVLLHYSWDGVRDTSFGGATDGIVVADFGGTGADATALALDSQGRILVAGSAYFEGGVSDFALARYNADGTADTTFGDGGITTADFWGNNDQANAIAVEPEGGIILAGYTDNGSHEDFALARFTCDGWLDPSFHGDARVSLDFDGGNDRASGVVVQADGRIIAAGWANTGGADHFALARYNSDGSLDADTFGTDGKVVTDFSDLGFDSENAHGMVLDANGNYVVAGTAHQTEYSSFALARYTPGTEGITVEVVNVPPTVNVVGWQQATAGLELSLPGMASFSHPGSDTPETFTYQIDWGDGTVDSGSLPDLTGDPLIIASIDGTHTYADGGMFYVAVTVTDADGGSDTQTILVTVNDDPPGADPDPGLLAAAREALGLPAGADVLTADWARLTSLSADSNEVRSLEGLQSATNLVSLTLVPSDFSDPGHLTSIAQLKNLNKLQNLTLERCGLSGSELTSTVLSTLTSLTTLDLRYNNIAVLPSATDSPPSLSTLLVYGNPLTDTPQAGLANLAGKPINVDLPADHPEKATTIADLAARLYKLPLKMYEYVLNTIEYQPYLGAMKGPLAVLQTGAGNDWDTDSLLAALFQAAGGITTSYVSGQIQVPIQQAEDYVGATDPNAAWQILANAGQTPTEIVDNNNQPIQMQFDHTWLQAQIGSATFKLDPSWKFRDFQPGIPDMLSQKPFDQNAYEAAMLDQQKQSAAEFYEDEVRSYLATHYTDKTLADVAHDGPIHPQPIAALSTSLPYTMLGVYRTDSDVPASKEYQVEVVLNNGGTQLFDWKNTSNNFLPTISLQRLTIDPNLSVNGSYTVAQPRLWLDGTQQTIAGSTVQWLTTNSPPSLSLTVNIFTPNPRVTYSTSYSRPADRYLAIGLDANQMSEQLLVSLRQTVNTQELNEKNNATVDRVAEIGGMLALAMATYFHDTDEGEKSIAGLTGAVPNGTVVATGLATSGPDIVVPPSGDNLYKLQMPYQPKGMGIDVPGNWWHLDAINGDFSQDAARDLISGYHNSSMEGLIWEELSNYDSISTMKAIQLTNYYHPNDPNAFKTLDPTNVHSQQDVNNALPNLPSGTRVHIYNYIIDPTNHYSVYVPTNTVTVGNGNDPGNPQGSSANPNGSWTGVGYTLTATTGSEAGKVQGFIIDDGVNAHGGGAYGDLPTPIVPLDSWTTATGLDPIATSNGGVIHDETDFSIPNLGTPLAMARHYHSFDTADSGTTLASDRGMGDGWSFSYSDRLVTSGSDEVWVTDNGVQLRFTPDGGNWKTPATIFGNLTHPGSDWLWTDKTGTQVKFNSDGYLTEIRDRYGNGVRVERDGAKITYVRDLFEYEHGTSTRYLQFAYNADSPVAHVTSIQDFTGRTWLYQYNADHRLVAVTAPSTFGAPLTMTQYAYFPESDTARKGLLQKFTDPDGNATLFDYYANRRGMSVTDAEGNNSSATYNIFRKQTALIAANGLPTDYTYDDKGDLTQVRAPDRTTATATWNTDKGLRLSSTDAFGQTTTYHYDTNNGNLLDTADPLEHVVHSTYTTTYNNLQSATRLDPPASAVSAVTFTTAGLLGYNSGTSGTATILNNGVPGSSGATLRLLGDIGKRISFSHTVTANTIIAFDFQSNKQGDVHSLGLDDNAGQWNPARQVQVYGGNTASGSPQEFNSYAASAAQTKHYVIPIGKLISNASYVSLAFVNDTTDPNAESLFSNVRVYEATATSTQYEYSGDDKSLTKITDALNDKTTFTYPTPNRGLPSSTMMPIGNNQQKQYGDQGPYGYTTTYGYNGAGQMTSLVSPVVTHDPSWGPQLPDLSITQRWDFDTQGNLTESTDGLGTSLGDPAHTTFYTYDLLGHRLTQTQPDPDGSGLLVQPVTTFVYDAASNLVSTSLATAFPQRTTSSVLDKMQRATKLTGPDSTYTTTQYDPNANVTATTDAMGRDTQYVYDSQNRPVATIRPDDTVVSTTYNGGGEVVGTTDANGNTAQYEYDKLSRKTADIAPYADTSKAITIDDGDSEFDTPSGSWTTVNNSGGLNSDYRTATGTASATWTFSTTVSQNFASSRWYEVLVTWVADTANSTKAQYTVYDGATASTPVNVNQKASPPLNATFSDAGWFSLGRFYVSPTNTLKVQVTNADSGQLVADGVKIIEVAPTVYQYDPQGNLQYVVDALGSGTSDTSHATEYRYDQVGHKKAVISPDPDDGGALLRPVTLYTYDANGNMQSVIDARGASDDTLDAYGNSTNDVSGNNAVHKTEYAYDEKGRQIQEKLPDPDDGGSLTNLYTWFYYDNNDNLRYVVDPKGADANRPQSFSASDDYTAEYLYDALNRKTTEKQPDPDGSGGSQTRPTTVYAYDNNGNLASVTDPDNNATRYVYDLKNRQTKITDALGAYAGDPAHTTTATFDAVGNAILVTDALGRITTTEHDALNRKISQTLPRADSAASSAPQTSWVYDYNGNLYATVDPRGNISYILSDGWNRPVETIDPLGHTAITGYDPLSRVTVVSDELGRTTQYVYDNLGRKTQQTAPDPDDYRNHNGTDGPLASPVTYYGYDLNGNLKWVTDPRGSTADDWNYTTYYFYDMLNRPVAVIDPKSTTTQSWTASTVPDTITLSPQPNKSTVTTYDALGDVSTVQDQMGRTTTYLYDNLGRKKEQDDPAAPSIVSGSSTTISPMTYYGYDLNGNVVYVTDPLGATNANGTGPGDPNHTTWTSYDALNRPVRSVSALGKSANDTHYATMTTYDNVGNVTSITDADSNTTRYTLDRLDRQVEERDPLGHSSFFQYDLAGNLVQKIDRENRVTQYVYDPLNQQIQEIWRDGSGQVVHLTDNYFDAAGQLLWVVDDDASYQYVYDRDGRLTRSRMAPGDLTQPTDLIYASGSVSGPGNFDLRLTVDGVKIGDVLRLLVTTGNFSPLLKIERPDGGFYTVSLPAGVSLDVTLNEIADATHPWKIYVGSSSGSGSYTLGYLDNPLVSNGLVEEDSSYDAAGNLLSVSDSSSVMTLGTSTSYEYDALNQVTKAKQSVSGTVNERADLGYYADGELHTIDRYAADSTSGADIISSTYAYDTAGRLTDLTDTLSTSSQPQPHYSYTLDAASRIVSSDLTFGSSTYNYLNDASTITLDNTNQLTGATHSNANIWNEDYDYDANGNRAGSSYIVGAGNRLLSDGTYRYSYDAEGNRTQRFVWTDSNSDGIIQDNEKSHITTYTYDQRNRLTAVTDQDNYQWATSVVDYSSQYSTDNGAAYKALGPPTIFTYGDDPNAWAPYLENNTSNYERLTLGFDSPVFADAVTICENWGNGFVAEVDVRDASTGVYYPVWAGTDPGWQHRDVAWSTTVSFTKTSYLVDAVRIWIDTTLSPSTWEEIDAVQLHGTLVVGYQYDYADRLVRKGIDADGSVGATPMDFQYFVHQGNKPLLVISDADGLDHSGSSPVLQDRLLNARDRVFADYQPQGAGAIWLADDPNGTARDMVFYNGSDYVVTHRYYDSFGNVGTEYRYYVGGKLVDTQVGFQGGLWDADVYLCFMGSSTPYDPITGQFTRQDQSFPPVETNLYRFDLNNPTLFVDPSGHQAEYSGVFANSTFSTLYPQYSNLDLSGTNFYNVTGGSLPGYSTQTISDYSPSNLSSMGYSSLGGSVVIPSYTTFTSAFSTASTVSGSWAGQVVPGSLPGTLAVPMPGGYIGTLSLSTSSSAPVASASVPPALALAQATPPSTSLSAPASAGPGVARNVLMPDGSVRTVVDRPDFPLDAGVAQYYSNTAVATSGPHVASAQVAAEQLPGSVPGWLGPVASLVGGFIPGVGETMDAYTLVAPDSTWLDRGLSSASLAANFFTAGFAPNFGSWAKAGRGLEKMGTRAASAIAETAAHIHHALPKFLGGNTAQVLSRLHPSVHGEFHSLLSQNLKRAGIPLNVGGRGGSYADWARYMNLNPGAQRQAFDAVLDASRAIDVKYGTNITQDVWTNIMQSNFRPHP
jgi:uncharacterized delta-60 repeat protein/RHS repeat-associated protein